MAAPAKTYAQQVQDLKGQVIEKDQLIEHLQEKADHVIDLEQEVESLKAKLSTENVSDHQETVSNKSQLTDLQQVADSNAAQLKVANANVERLTYLSEQLKERLEFYSNVEAEVDHKNNQIIQLQESVGAVNAAFNSAKQQFQDASVEKDRVIDIQSRELQVLRMASQSQQKILFQVRDALQNAPDVIGSLKYIVGINGKSD